jgi:hypothetical protein
MVELRAARAAYPFPRWNQNIAVRFARRLAIGSGKTSRPSRRCRRACENWSIGLPNWKATRLQSFPTARANHHPGAGRSTGCDFGGCPEMRWGSAAAHSRNKNGASVVHPALDCECAAD